MTQVPYDWEQFIRSAQPVIAGSVARTLRRSSRPTLEQIDQLTEEIFEKLYGQLAAVKESAPAWLRAFACGAALDFLRTQNPRNRALEQTERAALLGRIARMLADAENRDRWVFWLYYRHGLTPQAIAEIATLKLSPAEVDQIIDRLAQLTDAEDHADFLGADDPGAAEPSCLGPADIARLTTAADSTDLEELFDHLADCDRCGSLLHDSLPARETVELEGLRTSSPEWQSALAERWSRETRTGWMAAAVSFARRLTQAEAGAPPKRVVRAQSAAISESGELSRDPPAPRARREFRSPPVKPAETESGSR